jgi:hypothetical protein
MPATGDRDPSTGSFTGGGSESSTGADDGTDEAGEFSFDLGNDTGDSSEGCCVPADGPGCSDDVIEACVCEHDPYCCEEAWDDACVNTAQLSGCSPCAGAIPPQLDCCTSNVIGGCLELDVQDCVCAVDAYCCEQAWDETCVGMVDDLGCGICNVR